MTSHDTEMPNSWSLRSFRSKWVWFGYALLVTLPLVIAVVVLQPDFIVAEKTLTAFVLPCGALWLVLMMSCVFVWYRRQYRWLIVLLALLIPKKPL